MPQYITIVTSDDFSDSEETTFDAIEASTEIRPASRVDPNELLAALGAFCSDIEAAYMDPDTGEIDWDALDWPDLQVSYERGKALLDQHYAEQLGDDIIKQFPVDIQQQIGFKIEEAQTECANNSWHLDYVPCVYVATLLDGSLHVGWHMTRKASRKVGDRFHFDHGAGITTNSDAVIVWMP